MSLQLNKYINKYTITVAGIALLVISILINMNMRSKLSAVRSELASSKVMYTLVETEKLRLDSLIGSYKRSVTLRDSIITLKDKYISKQVANIALLENNLKNLYATLDKVTADSSYKYINQRIVPVAEKKYGFDSIQVKGIHYTFLERDDLFNLNLNNSRVIGDLLGSTHMKDLQITDLKNLNSAYLSKEAILRKEQESNQVVIEGLNQTVKQQQRQKNIILGGAVGVATIIIIKSITK
jgi:hypothetical protein